MIRRHVTALRVALTTADTASSIVLFVALSSIVLGLDWRRKWEVSTGTDPLIPGLAFALAWTTASWLVGMYRLRSNWTIAGDIRDILRLGATVACATIITIFVLNLDEVSRPLVVSLILGQMAITFLTRLAIRGIFGWLRIRGYNTRQILVLGTGETARSFTNLIHRHQELGLDIAGYLRPNERGSIVVEGPILGGIDDLVRIFHERVVDEVAICLPVSDWEYIEPVTVLCREEGKAVRIPLADIGLAWFAGRVEDLDGVPVLSHVHVPDQTVGLVAKKAMDIGLAVVGLIALSPLFLAVSAIMLATDGGPIFFRQVRVGLQGRPFTIIKFRTMVADAEDRYAAIAAMSDTQGAAFKMTNDPRITPLGAFLRRTSIDELPQLWNVLRGQMSIVGPRPAPPREVADYDIWHRRRLSMKPGITGLWQVEARLDESFDRRAALDLRYIDGWSVWLDLKIILRTIPAMLQGR
ncbi:MAG TPA: sugar transferase [Candidatus Limnocylindrales bacterium]|nr:sugar transferase [Candidatus Limnocylindrales bacterium]